jgi:hydroxymethylpyrimidine pyrophosphatase-like HAD family hydrolase
MGEDQGKTAAGMNPLSGGENLNRKIIFLDIDGTLSIQNRVPPSAKRACRAARRNGHILYICTGRARLQVSQTITHIGFDGIISSGGAYIESSAAPCHTADGIPRPAAGKNGGGTLFEASIEREKLLTLTAYLEERRAAYMLELTDKLIGGPYLKSYFEKYYSGRPLTIKSLLERIFLRKVFKRCEPYNGSLECGNVRKVVFWERDGLTFEDIKREFGGGIEIFRLSIPVAGMSGGEIGPLGIHKGSALEKVAAYHGFELADTIAFGDSDNDRTMIQLAGLGVAMGNAEPSLKAEAGDVTDSVENDGLAKAFKKYGLI